MVEVAMMVMAGYGGADNHESRDDDENEDDTSGNEEKSLNTQNIWCNL